MYVSLLLFCFAVFLGAVRSYDWGDSDTACMTMMPKLEDENVMEIQDEMYYRVGATTEKFYPGQKLYIRIKGKTSEDRYTYRGAFLTVLQEGPVGTWEPFHESKYRRVSCGDMENVAVVEANDRKKVVGDDVFIWKAPDVCDPENTFYELTATVVKSDKEYLPSISFLMECMQMPVKDEKMEKEMPEDACEANYYMIPKMNETSFETNYGGWWNSPMATLRWSRHEGPTGSLATGPMGAKDQRWYVYTEASHPAKLGDMAVLMGPFGLAGCFCMRLYVHANMGRKTKFEIAVNDEVMYTLDKSVDKWTEAHVSVNHPGKVMVELRMTRGNDFRGDIAVDMVSFTPGICAEYRTEEKEMTMMEEETKSR